MLEAPKVLGSSSHLNATCKWRLKARLHKLYPMPYSSGLLVFKRIISARCWRKWPRTRNSTLPSKEGRKNVKSTSTDVRVDRRKGSSVSAGMARLFIYIVRQSNVSARHLPPFRCQLYQYTRLSGTEPLTLPHHRIQQQPWTLLLTMSQEGK